jgi:hypothetical protein
MEKNDPVAQVSGMDRCPHLGLPEDPQTALAFPSPWNYCHHARPKAPVATTWQTEFCHSAGHTACPLLQQERRRPLPPEARSRVQHHHRHRRGVLTVILVLAGIMFASILLLAWLGPERVQAAWAQPPQVPATVPSTAALPAAFDPAATAAPGPAQTAVPALTPTGEPISPSGAGICGYKLDEAFGADPQFVLHQARGGESLNIYAGKYSSSIAAILAANRSLELPLQINAIVVIPLGVQEWSGPAFDPYYQPRDGAPLKALLESTGAAQEPFLRYNAFPSTCQTFTGWMLVPSSLSR